MGWVTITHPFHPLRGMRFEALPCDWNKQDSFVLKGVATGRVIIPRDWTDRADPDPYQFLAPSPPALSLSHLLQLADFVDVIDQVKSKK